MQATVPNSPPAVSFLQAVYVDTLRQREEFATFQKVRVRQGDLHWSYGFAFPSGGEPQQIVSSMSLNVSTYIRASNFLVGLSFDRILTDEQHAVVIARS